MHTNMYPYSYLHVKISPEMCENIFYNELTFIDHHAHLFLHHLFINLRPINNLQPQKFLITNKAL